MVVFLFLVFFFKQLLSFSMVMWDFYCKAFWTDTIKSSVYRHLCFVFKKLGERLIIIMCQSVLKAVSKNKMYPFHFFSEIWDDVWMWIYFFFFFKLIKIKAWKFSLVFVTIIINQDL